jgi:alpha-tubulin suppressor-like RCC1 family protein
MVKGVCDDGEEIEMIACGYFHTIIMTTKGKVMQSG